MLLYGDKIENASWMFVFESNIKQRKRKKENIIIEKQSILNVYKRNGYLLTLENVYKFSYVLE